MGARYFCGKCGEPITTEDLVKSRVDKCQRFSWKGYLPKLAAALGLTISLAGCAYSDPVTVGGSAAGATVSTAQGQGGSGGQGGQEQGGIGGMGGQGGAPACEPGPLPIDDMPPGCKLQDPIAPFCDPGLFPIHCDPGFDGAPCCFHVATDGTEVWCCHG